MNPLAKPTPANPAWQTALSIAVILASVALCAVPRLRMPLVVGAYMGVSLANGALLVLADWRRGLLSLTPRELLSRAQAGERLPRHTLGFASVVATCITQWQVTMG
jgi:hypothetical protein